MKNQLEKIDNQSFLEHLYIDADIKYTSKNNVEHFNKCFIGKIPIMIGSNIDKIK